MTCMMSCGGWDQPTRGDWARTRWLHHWSGWRAYCYLDNDDSDGDDGGDDDDGVGGGSGGGCIIGLGGHRSVMLMMITMR